MTKQITVNPKYIEGEYVVIEEEVANTLPDERMKYFARKNSVHTAFAFATIRRVADIALSPIDPSKGLPVYEVQFDDNVRGLAKEIQIIPLELFERRLEARKKNIEDAMSKEEIEDIASAERAVKFYPEEEGKKNNDKNY